MNWPPETWEDWAWLLLAVLVFSVASGVGRGIGIELYHWFRS